MARAPVAPGRVGDLCAALERLGGPDGGPAGPPFSQLPGLHFARLFLLEDERDRDGNPIPASLVYTSEVDAPVDDRVRELATHAGPALDATFGLCTGYPESPDPESRAAFLRAHSLPSPASYVNTIGRTVAQIQDEARLRDAIEAFLDRRRAAGDLPGTPAEVRDAIQEFVRRDPQLKWAMRRAPKPSLRWRVRELAHALALPAAGLLLAPLIVVALLVYLPLLRLHELRDPAPHLLPDPDHVRRLSAADDHVAHNPFTAIGDVKRGSLRLGTVKAVLALIDFGARHIFKRADLAGVKTIHFAHWIPVDGYRRVIFTSYYDGSLESYMDDFIDKVAFGLNASFSNGVGYPKTLFLLWQGAKREEEFKAFLRRHQIPAQVWYSAYPQLTARNIENNALIRSGLSGTLAPREAEAWLRRL
jgi:hypothetical protein